jgi:hypothetical protein
MRAFVAGRTMEEKSYWPMRMPGSAHSSSIGRVGRPPGLFASREYLPSGRTTRPPAYASIIAVATYQAQSADATSTQPAAVTTPCEP